MIGKTIKTKRTRKIKVLYDYQPACLKDKVGVPVFVENLYGQLINIDMLEVHKTSFCLEKYLKKVYGMTRIWEFFNRKIIIPLRMLLGQYDFYIENSYLFMPYFKPKKTKVINFIFDIGIILHDEIQSKDITEHWRKSLPVSLRNSDIVVTVSKTSKQDIIEYLKHTKHKIGRIEYIYCDANIIEGDMPLEENVLARLGVFDDYFLFLGTLEPRKNPLNLLKAFHEYKNSYHNTTTKLVFAGKKGWLYDEVMNYIEKHNLKDEIIFTGYVTESEKYYLLKKTKAFIFLSIYEGFGIPPLEALKLGTPVLLSDIPVFREIFKDSALYADPMNIKNISDLMHKITNNPPHIRQALLNRYSWKKSAKKLLNIMKEEVNL